MEWERGRDLRYSAERPSCRSLEWHGHCGPTGFLRGHAPTRTSNFVLSGDLFVHLLRTSVEGLSALELRLADHLAEQMSIQTGHRPAPGEVRSWQRSLPVLRAGSSPGPWCTTTCPSRCCGSGAESAGNQVGGHLLRGLGRFAGGQDGAAAGEDV